MTEKENTHNNIGPEAIFGSVDFPIDLTGDDDLVFAEIKLLSMADIEDFFDTDNADEFQYEGNDGSTLNSSSTFECTMGDEAKGKQSTLKARADSGETVNVESKS